jgi:galactose-1-phosphate uridylyltransferase
MPEEYGHIPDGFYLPKEEIEELRKSKKELTEYGKQQLRKLMTDFQPTPQTPEQVADGLRDAMRQAKKDGVFDEPIHAKVSDEDFQKIVESFNNPQPYPDAMFEEAERREAERKALDALDKLYEENGNAMVKLAEIEKEEWERKERSDTVLARYNYFYNTEVAGTPHGTPITPEHQQAMALECMVDALICENMNVEYNAIAIDDIKDLIARLYQQSNEFLKRVKEFKDSADGVA